MGCCVGRSKPNFEESDKISKKLNCNNKTKSGGGGGHKSNQYYSSRDVFSRANGLIKNNLLKKGLLNFFFIKNILPLNLSL